MDLQHAFRTKADRWWRAGKKSFSHLHWEWMRREHTFMIVMAILIGIAGGYGAIVFRWLISGVQAVLFGAPNPTIAYFASLPWYIKLLVPAIGGLIVGPLVYHFAWEARGNGLPEVMEALTVRSGKIRPRVAVAKTIASAVSIGSGGSVGREGPIVQIGSALGSTLGQLVKVRGTTLRTMAACGASAGIAATFNAPIAGAIFSIEILLRDFGIRHFSPIVVSSVTATAISRHYLGDYPAFRVPEYSLVSAWEFLPYALLGVLAAVVGVSFIRVLFRFEDFFNSLRIRPWLKPAVGGIAVGCIALLLPHILGVGYETIDTALSGRLSIGILAVLIVAKIFATSLTIASGGSGGVFAPSLFIGACLGALVGETTSMFFPQVVGEVGAYALVGMGAVAAATMHAPITNILMIFELTGDYRIILPLMISVILSVVIKMQLKQESIYTEKLKRKGIDLREAYTVNVLSRLKVRDVMEDNYLAVDEDTDFATLHELTSRMYHLNYFVTDKEGRLLGILSPWKIRELARQRTPSEVRLRAKDLIVRQDIFFTPDDPLDKIVPVFSDFILDQIPIVDNPRDRHLIAQVTKSNLLEAYHRQILKEDTLHGMLSTLLSADKLEEVGLTGEEVICEMEIPGTWVEKSIAELDVRSHFDIEIVLIKRPTKDGRYEILVPRSNLRFLYGDKIVVVGQRHRIERLKPSV